MEVDSGDSEAEKTHEKSHLAGSVSDTGEQTAAMAPSCWDRDANRSEWSRGSEQSPLNP